MASQERRTASAGTSGSPLTHRNGSGMWVSHRPILLRNDHSDTAMIVHRGLTVKQFQDNVLRAFKPLRHEQDQDVSAPITEGYEWHGSHQFETDRIVDNEHSVRLSGCQYFSDLTVFTGSTAPSGLNRGGVFLITPQFFGGRLTTLANLFQFFKFRRIRIVYVPTTPTTAPGSSIIYYSSNNDVSAAQNGVAELTIASSLDSFVSTPVWHEASMDLDLSESLPMYSCVPGSVEESSLQGVLCTGASNITAGSTLVLGQLFMQFEIDFFHPRISRTLEGLHTTSAVLTYGALTPYSPSTVVRFVQVAPAAATPTIFSMINPPTGPAFGVVTWNGLWTANDPVETWLDASTGQTASSYAYGINLFFRSFLAGGLLVYNLYLDAGSAESGALDVETGLSADFTGSLTYLSTGFSPAAAVTSAVTLQWYYTDLE